MRIGIPAETKTGEKRVALTPQAVASLTAAGHDVTVQSGAGASVGFDDAAFRTANACIASADEAWAATLVVKVKELQDAELSRPIAGQTLFAFQHLPGEPQRARALAGSGTTAIAFEMVRDGKGGYPLLAPMSRIAGRLAIDVARRHLGASPRDVLVLGAGHAGEAAAAAARAAGANVTVLRRSTATREAVERAALAADLVVGAVFIPGEPTPKLLPRPLVARMRRGAMIVDISIDAGGVAETSRPTTHEDPVFECEGILHYAVANMPAAVPREATEALSAAILPYVHALAAKGTMRALLEDGSLRGAVLAWRAGIAHAGIAQEAGVPYTPVSASDLHG